MSEIVKCHSCKGDFDGQLKVPVILPCKHHVCVLCAFIQFQKDQTIKCVQQTCQQIHQINPINLQKDIQLLKRQEQNALQQIITQFELQKSSLTQAQAQLAKQQAKMIYQVIQHLNSNLFKNTLAIQRELQKVAKTILQQLNFLKIYQKQQMKQQGDQKQFQLWKQKSKDQQLDLIVQKLLVSTQNVLKQNSQISTNIYEELAQMKTNMKQVTEANSNYQIQLQQQNQLIQSLQQDRQNFKDQIKTLLKEVHSLTSQQSQYQSEKLEQQQNLSQVQQYNIYQPIEAQQYQQQAQSTQAIQEKKQYSEQNQSQQIQITIVSPNKRTVEISVSLDDQIWQLKEQIKQQTGLRSDTLNLFKNTNSQWNKL